MLIIIFINLKKKKKMQNIKCKNSRLKTKLKLNKINK